MSADRIEIGICGSVSNSGVFAGAGAEYVEVNVQGFLKPEAGDAEFAPSREAAKSSARPLKAANCFLPGGLKSVGSEVDSERLVRYAESAFERAAQVGIDKIVFGSGGSRSLPEGFPKDEAIGQIARFLKAIAPAAERHGVTVVMEPLNSGECNFVNSLAEAAEIVERCNHPSVRLLADIFHMLRDKEPPGEIKRFGALLHHVHIAEVEKRTAPGVAGDDFRPYLKALAAAGYAGGISLECGWEDLESQAPAAVENLRGQMKGAGL